MSSGHAGPDSPTKANPMHDSGMERSTDLYFPPAVCTCSRTFAVSRGSVSACVHGGERRSGTAREMRTATVISTRASAVQAATAEAKNVL